MSDIRLGLGLLFLGFGLLFLGIGFDQRWKRRALLRRTVRVRARVVSVRTESSSDDGGVSVHYPTLEFQAGGTRVRAEAIVGRVRGEEVLVGHEATAYFDPERPTRVVLAPGDWTGGGCVTLLGLALALLGVLVLTGSPEPG